MEEHKNRSEKKEYITLLNVCSAIAVVFLHVNNEAYNGFAENLLYWPVANVIRSLFYFAVPIFFMISGANLLDYNLRYSNKDYAIKRIKKTLIPFLIWSVVGFFYFILFESPQTEITFVGFLNGLINAQYVGTYWFFIPLFLIYLAIPVFALIPQDKKVKAYSYFVLVGFTLNIFIPYLLKVFQVPMMYYVSFWPVSGYMIYALLGYVIDRTEIDRKGRILIYIFGLFGLAADCVGTFAASAIAGKIDETYSGYLNLPCILYSAAVFVLFKYPLSNVMKKNSFAKVMNVLVRYTFGIYLLHRPLLQIILSLIPMIYVRTGHLIDIYSIWFELIAAPLVILICIPVIWLIHRIPLLKATIP